MSPSSAVRFFVTVAHLLLLPSLIARRRVWPSFCNRRIHRAQQPIATSRTSVGDWSVLRPHDTMPDREQSDSVQTQSKRTQHADVCAFSFTRLQLLIAQSQITRRRQATDGHTIGDLQNIRQAHQSQPVRQRLDSQCTPDVLFMNFKLADRENVRYAN